VPKSRRIVIVTVVTLIAISTVLRCWHVDQPKDYMFDEVYYAKDAKAIVDGRVGPNAKKNSWEPGDEVSWPHPEAGKFAIALGIALAGDRPVGWRLSSVVAGVVLLCCIYPLARRLGLPRPWALAALLMAAADPLNLVQSRIATLDVFVAMWTVVCILFALRYVQERRSLWLLMSGVVGGLALATKWSGALALVAAAAIVLLAPRLAAQAPEDRAPAPAGETGTPDPPPADDQHSRSEASGIRSSWRPVVSGALLAVVCLVAVPLVVYLLSYSQYFWSGHTWSDWRELHRQMWHFNLTLSAPHSYASAPVTWIADYRPVWYSFLDTDGMYEGVVATGNPFLWWTAIAALVAVPVASLRGRGSGGALLTAVVVAILYLPWMAVTRTSFLYYMAPVAPMLAILVAQALWHVSGAGPEPKRPPWRDLVPLAAGFVLAAFFWYPIGRACEALFWRLSDRLGEGVAVAVAATAGGLALAGILVLLTRTRRPDVRSAVSWLWTGAISGIFVAFLPILIASPIPADEFYHLIWFPSWI
jgi:dolichyl-phosphate-mannose-protein mannosyltransferase